jgi:predicted N-acetyltransferase YhbS
MNKEKNLTKKLVTRTLREDEIEKAEELVRLAFGTFLNVPDPLENSSQRRMIAHRFHQDPRNVLAAILDGELVGTNVLTRWGSFAFFGPLAVKPELWDSNIGTQLVKEALAQFVSYRVSNLGLFTFSDSPKHLGLYHKFGFCSRFLTPLMEKKIEAPSAERAEPFQTFANLDQEKREFILLKLRDLTNTLHPGLDLTSEIKLVEARKMGDTVILMNERSQPVGFAIIQSGANTEAGLDRCYVKFGATLSGLEGAKYFGRLLSACEDFAHEKKAEVLEAGLNLSHSEAFELMLARNYRISFIGVSMLKPNEPAHEREGTFVMDDWR